MGHVMKLSELPTCLHGRKRGGQYNCMFSSFGKELQTVDSKWVTCHRFGSKLLKCIPQIVYAGYEATWNSCTPLSELFKYSIYMLGWWWWMNRFGQPQVKKKHAAQVTLTSAAVYCFLLTVNLALPYSSLGKWLQKYSDVGKSVSVQDGIVTKCKYESWC